MRHYPYAVHAKFPRVGSALHRACWLGGSEGGGAGVGGGVLVVDALGLPPLARQLLALIRQVAPLPIRYGVVTHCHADHPKRLGRPAGGRAGQRSLPSRI